MENQEQPSIKESPSPESLGFSETDIQKIAEAIFPEEKTSVINDTIKFYTDQKKLEDYQKLLVSPANAVETVIKFGISLFDKETYKNLKQAVEMMTDENARAMLIAGFKKGWNNLSETEKAAFLTELIFSTMIVYGGIQKLGGVIPAEKLTLLTKTLQNKEALLKLSQAIAKTGKFIAASPIDDVVVGIGPAASKLTGQ